MQYEELEEILKKVLHNIGAVMSLFEEHEKVKKLGLFQINARMLAFFGSNLRSSQ